MKAFYFSDVFVSVYFDAFYLLSAMAGDFDDYDNTLLSAIMLLFVFVVLYISKSNFTVTVQVRVQTTGCGRKKYPHKSFWQHFPDDWKFFTTVLHTFCLFISTQNYKMLFSYL